MIYSVYVGKYKTQNESKSDSKKLQKLGVSLYLFNKQNFYSFKIKSFTDISKANILKQNLTNQGFLCFVEAT